MPRDSGVCFQSAPLSPHTLGYVKRISTPVFLIDSLVDGVDFHVAEMDTTNIWGGKRNKGTILEVSDFPLLEFLGRNPASAYYTIQTLPPPTHKRQVISPPSLPH